MSGKGTLTWTNGDSFKGSWLNGIMHGFGMYTWSNSDYYVGTWTQGLKDGKGTFYPKGSKLPAVQQLYLNALRERGLLPDMRKQNQVSHIHHYTSVDIEDVKKCKRRQKKLAKEIKRPGEQIIKGHRSYDLMLSLQLGIRYNVGKITPIQRREVQATDFGPHASFWMNFPKEGSQLTPPHQSEDFRWKDYCPMVFRNLREMFKIDAADYMMSICGNDALRELSSPGKSGSVFFLSQDDRFMIKTL
ncbi:phosphatidylinositol 4-phosphate 5-kinase 9-like [Olea europaea subsp. europaea]|uniref:1-phosphatidylinositol-4-phosphate 5-kinase n=1 Tax=Olea europaea subsp. europaea TaxID=158383 RepID=A0A8S0R4G2_OLEEU|nr:phosphatidylinositol 4-phosphate 5-kinase 9-like [Olea europaea subsp. europaea]